MKNYFVLFPLLLLFSALKAQLPGFPLIDATSKWYVQGEFIFQDFTNCNQQMAIQTSTITYSIVGDTMIIGNTYFKFHYSRKDSSFCLSDPTITWVENSGGQFDFIRETNNQLLRYDPDTQEEVVFKDYNNINIGTVLSSDCTVNQIDTLYLLNQPYLKYICDCNEEFIIEGIGSKRHLYAQLDCGSGIEGDWRNLCYEKNGFVINVDPDSDCQSTGDTTEYVGINSISISPSLEIYPSPFINMLNISANHTTISKFNVISLGGRVLITKENIFRKEVTINTSKLNTGIYFVTIELENGDLITKKIYKF